MDDAFFAQFREPGQNPAFKPPPSETGMVAEIRRSMDFVF